MFMYDPYFVSASRKVEQHSRTYEQRYQDIKSQFSLFSVLNMMTTSCFVRLLKPCLIQTSQKGDPHQRHSSKLVLSPDCKVMSQIKVDARFKMYEISFFQSIKIAFSCNRTVCVPLFFNCQIKLFYLNSSCLHLDCVPLAYGLFCSSTTLPCRAVVKSFSCVTSF